MIEPRYGLLNHLLSLGVLSDEELEEVHEYKINVNKTVSKLLELLQCKQEVDPFQSFLEALKATSQSHVVNFLLQKEGGRKWNLLRLIQMHIATDFCESTIF